MFKKILVISNNPFSKTNSNGRTLAGFFKGYPSEKLAQFFIKKESPDFDVCTNYFRVTDSEALNAFVKGQKVGSHLIAAEQSMDNIDKITSNQRKKSSKTPLTMLIREFVWQSYKWVNNNFENWIKSFEPEVVLLQSGDSAFMLKIATDIAKKNHIPLIIYNSENYYFKKNNYFTNSGVASIFYHLFISRYRKQFRKTIEYASHSIYICDSLKEIYDNEFNKPSTTIMTATDIVPCTETIHNSLIPVVSYLGNLGVGRHESLIEISDALQSINLSYKLDVYGKFPNDEIKEKMISCKGINYKGFVSYEEVIKIIQDSDLLIHTENFSDFYKEDLKFAFSTKIADSLSSGTCFFFYAPAHFASTQYLIENKCACVVTDKTNLKSELNNIINNIDKQHEYIKNAQKTVKKNHSKDKNNKKFVEIINESYTS